MYEEKSAPFLEGTKLDLILSLFTMQIRLSVSS